MMTDVVREVKEAARVREEALLSRVRALVEERTWTMNESNLKLMRDFEEMKVNPIFVFTIIIFTGFNFYNFHFSKQIQINQMKAERLETKAQVTKLEEEVQSLRKLMSHMMNFGTSNTSLNMACQSSPIHSTDNNSNRLNASNQNRRSLCINYGTIKDEKLDQIRPMQQQFNDLLKEDNFNHHNNSDQYSNTDNENHDMTIVQMEKDNIDLRRELQDTRASKKHADKKIQE